MVDPGEMGGRRRQGHKLRVVCSGCGNEYKLSDVAWFAKAPYCAPCYVSVTNLHVIKE